MRWSSIRVEVDAARRLDEYRRGLENAVQKGVCPHPTEPKPGRVSLGQALIQLLNAKQRHLERGAAHAERRRSKPRNTGDIPATVIDPPAAS